MYLNTITWYSYPAKIYPDNRCVDPRLWGSRIPTFSHCLTTYGFNTESVEVGFGLDTDNNWDVECQFVVDPGYVTAYNAENGTAYKLFPEGNYSFEDVVTLPTGMSTTDLAVTLNGNGLTPGRIYVTYSFG